MEKIPYFCPNVAKKLNENGEQFEEKCGKILRPIDIKMYFKIGMCTDCQSDLSDHIKITGAPELGEELKKRILSAFDEIRKEDEGKTEFQTYGDVMRENLKLEQ